MSPTAVEHPPTTPVKQPPPAVDVHTPAAQHPGATSPLSAAPRQSDIFSSLTPPTDRALESKTPDFGVPFTHHPPGGAPAPAAPLLPITREPTEPGSQRDVERREASQAALEGAPVFGEGGFELATTGSAQHPLVELAKRAARALQVDKDPEAFADCFDDKAEVLWHRLALGKETQKLTGRDSFVAFAKDLISHGFSCVPAPTSPGHKYPMQGFSLRGPTLSIPMLVKTETSTARYFPPSGLVPGVWRLRMLNEKIGFWEFEATEAAIRRVMWGRDMDSVPIIDAETGQKKDAELGELVKKLARCQLMGDTESFVSCFDPDHGRMVTVIDADGRTVLRKASASDSGGEKRVHRGRAALLQYAENRKEKSAYFLAGSPIAVRGNEATCEGKLFMDGLQEHFPEGLPGMVKVKETKEGGLLEEVEFLAT
ncbi:hypothetical protein DFJ74DRAFT_701530 [Hyaloraphidium curvatum]|nr:hypothetical protein DFJ74DRAFT_701530 [Hyaloraphidium curvatum]